MMLHWFNTVRRDWIGFARPRYPFQSMGRLLLVLASVVLIALPFTQQVWTWDRFLHGGQDFETTVLLILTSLCLVLVMARCCRQGIKLLLTLLSKLLVRRGSALMQPARTSTTCVHRSADPLITIFNFPLQI
jgi:hypothetical protein